MNIGIEVAEEALDAWNGRTGALYLILVSIGSESSDLNRRVTWEDFRRLGTTQGVAF